MTTTYETQIEKSRDGWRATSEAVISQTEEGQRILKLCTRKAKGGIVSKAHAVIRKDDGIFQNDSFMMFGDFDKRVSLVPSKRGTEKSIGEAHAYALTKFEEVITEAKEFYTGKEEIK
jgi:hypothetical protein